MEMQKKKNRGDGKPHRLLAALVANEQGNIFELDGYYFLFHQGYSDCVITQIQNIKQERD